MSESEFFIKLFFTGLFSTIVPLMVVCWIIFPVNLKERILYLILKALLVIACVVTAIGFYGMIWTF